MKAHSKINVHYTQWVKAAPPVYRSAFANLRFAIVTCRYGQNAAINSNNNLAQQAMIWERMHRWECIRSISIAIATDISSVPPSSPLLSLFSRPQLISLVSITFRAQRVAEWTPIDPASITARYNVIYDHHERAIRSQIENLPDYPLLDSHGRERPIYTTTGWPIPRRRAIFADNGKKWGVLADLTKMDTFFLDGSYFVPGGDNGLFDAPTPRRPRKRPIMRVFPQAGTCTLGHVQAEVLPPIARSFVRYINDLVALMTMMTTMTWTFLPTNMPTMTMMMKMVTTTMMTMNTHLVRGAASVPAQILLQTHG